MVTITYAPLGPQYGAMQSLHYVRDDAVWLNMIGRTSQSDCDIAINYASVVDIATSDCNFDAQMTGQPA
jgi:hypothetical protein